MTRPCQSVVTTTGEPTGCTAPATITAVLGCEHEHLTTVDGCERHRQATARRAADPTVRINCPPCRTTDPGHTCRVHITYQPIGARP